MDRKAVVVFLNSAKGHGHAFEHVSPAVRGAFYSEGMGNTIPRVVVSSPDQVEIWGKLDYKEIDKRNLSRLNRSVDDIVKKESGPIENNTFKWSIKGKGSFYSGKFVRYDANRNRVILKKPDTGKEVGISANVLAPGAVQYYKNLIELQGMKSGSDSTGETPLTYEEWESTDGRKIVAKFVSLSDGQVSIEMKDSGRVFTLPLSRLSAGSRKRAEEIAGGQ